MRSTPPDTAQIARLLVRHDFAAPLPVVAAFLAAPLTAAPGVGCGAWGGSVWVRGACVEHGDSVGALAEAAAEAAGRAGREGDRYLDLGGPPEDWYKVLVSGHRRVAFGPDLLWGTPKISLDGPVADGAVATVVAAYRAGQLRSYPAVLAGDHPVLVDGTARAVVLRPGASGEAGGRSVPAVGADVVVAAGADIARRLGGSLVRVTGGADHHVAVVYSRQADTVVGVRFLAHTGAYQLLDAGPAGGVEVADGFVAGAGATWVHRTSGIVATPQR